MRISDDAFEKGRCPGLPQSGASGVARPHGKRGEVAILIGVAIHIPNFGDLRAQAHFEDAVTRAVFGAAYPISIDVQHCSDGSSDWRCTTRQA